MICGGVKFWWWKIDSNNNKTERKNALEYRKSVLKS